MTLNPDDLIGRDVGPYTLDRLLGQGGFAWVFAAKRRDDGTSVAVKVLKPRYAGDRQFETRFRNEFEVASKLVHPHIVRIEAVGAENGITFFGMPLYPDSLGSLIEREGPLAEPRLLSIAIGVTSALAYAHEAGIVHRDIKVDNILLQADGQAVIADFGIARAVSGYESATGVNMTIGTPHYVSPEQAQGRPLDGRSDLYAVGVTLYKAMTGDLPFRSSDWFELARMHVEDTPAAPTAKRPDMSRRFERIILRCMAKHPDDRYPSAKELEQDLRMLEAGTKATAEFTLPLGGDFRPPKKPQRRWLTLLGAVALIVLVALAVVMLIDR
ncbi:MAG TPA: protein kinase [Gemmatimonadales bacterium]